MKHVHFSHVEPDQAAQMLGHGSGAPPPPRRDQSAPNASYNRPGPNSRPQDDRYGGRPNQGYQNPGAYGSSGPPPPPPQGQGYNDYGRQNSSRYDGYNQPGGTQFPRYGTGQGGQYSSQGGYYNQQAGGAPAPPPRNSSTNPYGVASPPPPASYGQGPPPQGYHNRSPIPDHQRPPTTAPPPPREGQERDALWPLFLQVDKGRTGQLSEAELQSALVNGDYTAFDPHTVKMMIRMFDTDRSGTINFDEFCGLWGFLAAWRALFDRFDVDRSGNISLREFEDALVAFGYRLSPQFVKLLFSTFAKTHSRGRGDDGEREKVLSFDLFVQACISLKRMTDVFKKYDSDRDGYITLSLYV